MSKCELLASFSHCCFSALSKLLHVIDAALYVIANTAILDSGIKRNERLVTVRALHYRVYITYKVEREVIKAAYINVTRWV